MIPLFLANSYFFLFVFFYCLWVWILLHLGIKDVHRVDFLLKICTTFCRNETFTGSIWCLCFFSYIFRYCSKNVLNSDVFFLREISDPEYKTVTEIAIWQMSSNSNVFLRLSFLSVQREKWRKKSLSC